MKLIEVFNQLTTGELSQLNIGGSEQGEITEANYGHVVNHINLGLTALYTRFNLKENQLILQLTPGRLTYPLQSGYAVTNTRSRELVRYILDSDNPFKDDVLKVESCLTEAGIELPLNDAVEPLTLKTPSATYLRVPTAIVEQSLSLPDGWKTSTLTVVYRAKHFKLDINAGSFNPETLELELPESHLLALLYFVAARAHSPLGMVNEFNASNNFASKYELECQRLEMENVEIDQIVSNTRLLRNGWV